MRQTPLIAALLLIAATVHAKPVLTVTCAEPTGSRFDLVQGQLKHQPDAFSGATPVFVTDDSKPKSLIVVWGNAKWAKDMGIPANAEEASVQFASEEMITATFVDPLGSVKMYSLYPKQGLAYFTQHRYMNVMGGVPSNCSFFVNCVFART